MKLNQKLSAQQKKCLKAFASLFASIGGRSKSIKKAKAARKNGKLGGRPKGKK